MNLKGYHYITSKSLLDYEFFSEGPNGKIKKVVRFEPANSGGITYFNLCFGDWKEKKQGLDDMVISNNQDRDKILATVALAVLDFTEHFSDVGVFAQGSTPARTRLYQLSIARHWKAIQTLLYVYGYINGSWEPFRKSVNYRAFLAYRK